jgi:hypothetical protein
VSANRTRCATHQQQNPCTGCAADHLLGEHEPGSCRGTCRKCRARPAPLVEAGTHRPNHALPDVAALAAHDTDLTEEP